jgi:hypothetical protein
MPMMPKRRAFDAYQESLPVRLMATRRNEFSTCKVSESFASVQRRNDQSSFDFMPVVGDDEASIIGVLAMDDRTQRGDLVRDRCTTLHEDLLIGSDVSILDFVRKADQQPFCFVIDGHRIGGLVSLSDLQQLPVRAALFAMVTQLEMTMTEVIAASFEGDTWLGLLSSGRQKELDHALQKATVEHNQVDSLLYTQFCDKADILRKQGELDKWGVRKADWKADFRGIQSLRDQLAHGNDFAVSAEAARKVCALVRTIDDWLARLDGMLSGVRPPMIDNGARTETPREELVTP